VLYQLTKNGELLHYEVTYKLPPCDMGGILYTPTFKRHDGALCRAYDLRFTGRVLEFCVGTVAQWPWQATYIRVLLSPSSIIILVPAKSGVSLRLER